MTEGFVYVKHQDDSWFQSSASDETFFLGWRNQKNVSTGYFLFVLCLNIGCDSPSITNKRSGVNFECWIDPEDDHAKVSIRRIGHLVKEQYLSLHPRRFSDPAKHIRICLDPSSNCFIQTCQDLRQEAVHNQRTVFHYNGHGVPAPSPAGEVWFFDDQFALYVPVSVYSIHRLMSAPSLYIFDCPYVGRVTDQFSRILDAEGVAPESVIVLGPCGRDEALPIIEGFPLDIFTSCLTTSLRVALKFWKVNNRLIGGVTDDEVDSIPGTLRDRRTPLGELQLILTTITDMVAWDILEKPLFVKLFRQDRFLANVLRNFLLADRVLRSIGGNPVSIPRIPGTHKHRLWKIWDHTLDLFFSQRVNRTQEYSDYDFFRSQLKNFEISLQFGDATNDLPLVFMVLINLAEFRVRALSLLTRYLRGGRPAVKMVLFCGFLPYILKLLKFLTTSIRNREMERLLITILRQIVLSDRSCVAEMAKFETYILLIKVLQTRDVDIEVKIDSCFLLSSMMFENVSVKHSCLNTNDLIGICQAELKMLPSQIEDDEPDDSDRISGSQSPDGRRADRGSPVVRERRGSEGDAMTAPERLQKRLRSRRERATRIRPELPPRRSGGPPKSIHRAASASSLGAEESEGESDPDALDPVLVALYEQWLCVTLREGCEDIEDARRYAFEISVDETLLRLAMKHRIPEVRASAVYALAALAPSKIDALFNVSQRLTTLAIDGASIVKQEVMSLLTVLVACYKKRIEVMQTADTFDSDSTLDAARLQSVTADLSVPSSLRSRPQRPVHMRSISMTDGTAKVGKPANLRIAASRRRALLSRPKSLSQAPKQLRFFQNLTKVLMLLRGNILTEIAEQAKALLDDLRGDLPPRKRKLQLQPHSYYRWCAEQLVRRHLLLTAPVQPQRQRPRLTRTLSRDSIVSVRSIQTTKAPSQYKSFENQYRFLSMKFHPSRPLLFVNNRFWGINIWDYEKQERVQTHLVKNSTDFTFLNNGSLLLVCVSNGNIGIFKDVLRGVKIIAGLTVFSDLRSGSVKVDWHQDQSALVVGCAEKPLKVWDLCKELEVASITPNFTDELSSLTMDQTRGGSVFAAGFNGGAVAVFDQRTHSMVARLHEHRERVVGLHMPHFMQNLYTNQILSSCVDGTVKYWDPRMFQSTKSVRVIDGPLSDTDVHNIFPIMVSGSRSQFFKVFNLSSNEPISSVHYQQGILAKRIDPVSVVQFHDTEYLFATGSGQDTKMITIYR